ncbi:MAG TPA: hypothetical protein VEJ87_06785, partial [Acidimicrobiales bacterium]|nr:hypothetical protein [Acidimicrobiales bacterium]
MSSRVASDGEVRAWREQGWVLLDGLVGAEEVDAVGDDLREVFPSCEEYNADPEGVTERRRGRPVKQKEQYVWPEEGPGFRPDQQQWMAAFPFEGSGFLNRLCVHPSIVDFAERALGSKDIRLYQAHASAKYSGLTNYEQPMHTDRNHSWLPAGGEAPWWNLEGFLYLSDVTEDENPTRMVSLSDSAKIASKYPVVLPKMDPALYRAEHASTGIRGSYLAYRSETWHRGAPFGARGTARFVVALAFKRSGLDWIGYDQQQSRSTGPEWTSFVESSTPRELELFGFPPPGHQIWDDDLLSKTALRYPKLDLEPWRR